MFCIRCGSSIDEGERFCQNCGASVDSQAQGYTAPNPAESTRRSYEIPTPTENTAQSYSIPDPAQPEKKKSGGLKGHSMLYGILILLLGIAMTAISYATNDYEYTVYYGLMIVGVITFIAGLIEKLKK